MAAPDLKVQIQGQSVANADNLNTYVQWCSTVAQLRQFVGLSGMCVYLEGIATPADGGQGNFFWQTTVTQPDDGFNYIKPIAGNGGGWVRLTTTVSVESITIGTTTISNGTTNALLYDDGGVVETITPEDNGVLVTSGAGVPSISTTLPNGLAMGEPASLNLTNATLLPVGTGVSGLGSGVATALSNTAGGSGGFALESGLGAYLPLAGGTMSGNIAMGGHNITGIDYITAPASTNLNLQAGTGATLTLGVNGGSNQVFVQSGYIVPSANNAMMNGSSSDRWSNVYSVLGNFSGAVSTGPLTVNQVSANGLFVITTGGGNPQVGIYDTTNAGQLLYSQSGVLHIAQSTTSGTYAGSLLSLSTSALTLASGISVVPDQTAGIIGTTTNNNANSGSVGEYVESIVASGSAVSVPSSGNTINVTSISLTAGDWDVNGIVTAVTGAGTATALNLMIAGLSSTSVTFPTLGLTGYNAWTGSLNLTTSFPPFLPVGSSRFSLSTTPTIYLVGEANFTGGTVNLFGHIHARRVR